MSMIIMSFNIRYACDKGTEAWESRFLNIVPLIKGAAPDIIGIQEALHGQYTELTESLTEYGSVGVGRNDGISDGEYAAIFYRKERFSHLESGSFWLSETPDRPSLGWDAACIRICTYIRLYDAKTNKEFMHFNTHLDHAGQTAMLEGAKLVRQAVLERTIPAIITGDFNVCEGSPTYEIMVSKGLCDTKYNATSSKPHGTFHGYNPKTDLCDESPIDYIFYSENGFDAEDYRVLINGEPGAYTSDHYPVLAVLTQR